MWASQMILTNWSAAQQILRTTGPERLPNICLPRKMKQLDLMKDSVTSVFFQSMMNIPLHFKVSSNRENDQRGCPTNNVT